MARETLAVILEWQQTACRYLAERHVKNNRERSVKK